MVKTCTPAPRGLREATVTAQHKSIRQDTPAILLRPTLLIPFATTPAVISVAKPCGASISTAIPASAVPPAGSGPVSDYHDRSLSRGQKLSGRASEEHGCKFFSGSSPRVLASQPWFLLIGRTRLPFAGAALPAAQKIEFVFSCQSRN